MPHRNTTPLHLVFYRRLEAIYTRSTLWLGEPARLSNHSRIGRIFRIVRQIGGVDGLSGAKPVGHLAFVYPRWQRLVRQSNIPKHNQV